MKTIAERPQTCVVTFSLGTYADHLADGFGHTPSTILLLRRTYIESCQLPSPKQHFISQMTAHGMPHREASMYWTMMNIPPEIGIKPIHRDRICLGIE